MSGLVVSLVGVKLLVDVLGDVAGPDGRVDDDAGDR